MVTLNTLKAGPGSNRKRRRIGRGTGSGKGSTAGKGNNGHKARSGSTNKAYFEGGQTPLTRRIPKRGFHSPFKVEYQIVNVCDLEGLDLAGKEVNVELLKEIGLVHDTKRPLKILGNGELTKSLTIKATSFSKSAKDKIEKAKGKAEVISRV